MSTYVLALIASLLAEFLFFWIGIDVSLNVYTSQVAQFTLDVFGWFTAVGVMGITIAMFEPWRNRVKRNRISFRASRG